MKTILIILSLLLFAASLSAAAEPDRIAILAIQALLGIRMGPSRLHQSIGA